MRTLVGLVLAAGLTGCTVGEGTGEITSDKLYISGCWNGMFDLQPDFFAANPYREESLIIRVQRGDNNEEASDGLIVVIPDLQDVRKRLGEEIAVGLPPGVAPPGVPVSGGEDPAAVSLSLYLHQTCHEQNAATYAVGGTIRFSSLFSGNLNEENTDRRLTDAEFSADFADPRELLRADDAAAITSHVDGTFRFFFQRGQPAQPFQ